MKRLLVFLLVFLMVPCYILAENASVQLTKGKWIVGQDIAPGHYKMIQRSSVASVSGADYTQWISNHDECFLTEGNTIVISMGAITFVPVVLTSAQSNNPNYSKLEQYRHEAILRAYDDVCDLYHNLPLGSYSVGIDIPAGSWRVESWGNNVTTITITSGITKHRFSLSCLGFDTYTPGDLTVVYFILENGDIVDITNSTGKQTSGIYIFPDNHQASW